MQSSLWPPHSCIPAQVKPGAHLAPSAAGAVMRWLINKVWGGRKGKEIKDEHEETEQRVIYGNTSKAD